MTIETKEQMKTIKELEAKRISSNFEPWEEGYKNGLKDVLKLIDDFFGDDYLGYGEELKSKIEG